ncbi:MAG: leucine-rich repeat domain-containing protein [Treponema sp.]|jgi:hypothetical protein|nr:leucine-rich repeat domain-containing protein [Treponema sp.]
MLRKSTKYAVRHHRTAGLLYLGAELLFLLLLSGCPIYDGSYYGYKEPYHVYYEGNGNTKGFPPEDSKVYFSGHTATVLAKPEELKKGNLKFLGWQQPGNDTPLQPGDKIRIESENVWLYAWWEDDPNNLPYEYADDPDTNGVIITRYFVYSGYGRVLTIPNTLNGKPVTVIGEGAFADAYLEAVVLPNKLEVIGNKAFVGSRFYDIAIPDTVKSIGKLAFQNAYLQTISLGSGLESIDDYAFDGNYLTVLLLPASVTSLGTGAFYGNSLVFIEISSNVAIESGTSLGTYGASFRKYYQDKGSLAGVYLYNSGSWKGPYHE